MSDKCAEGKKRIIPSTQKTQMIKKNKRQKIILKTFKTIPLTYWFSKYKTSN